MLKFLLIITVKKIVDRLELKGDVFMYGYIAWPGAYSFKDEISLFMTYFKEQIDEVMKKIEETEDAIEK